MVLSESGDREMDVMGDDEEDPFENEDVTVWKYEELDGGEEDSG